MWAARVVEDRGIEIPWYELSSELGLPVKAISFQKQPRAWLPQQGLGSTSNAVLSVNQPA